MHCLAVVIVLILGLALPARAQGLPPTDLVSGLLDGHNAIMLLIDPANGSIVDANDAAESFYGYPLATLRSLHIQDINRLGDAEVAAERAKAVAEKRNYFIFPHKLASGAIRTVEVYSAPVKVTGARPLLLSIIHDISGKAVAEAELEAYRTRLEQLVERRTAEALAAEERLRAWLIGGIAFQALLIVLLVVAVMRRHATVQELHSEIRLRRRAEDRLGKAKADLQRFAEISAHHLREPTRHLMIFSQKLRKRLGRPADEDMELSLATIETEASYLHSLVRDVQIYLAADTPLGKIGDADADEVARTVVAGMGQALAESGGSVLIGKLPPLPIDSVRLKYLFAALLDNAVRYRHPDRSPLVRIEGAETDSGMVLRISDNGAGIPDEYRERVLDVFEHLGGHRESQGTGLGLAVARRIVESCEGHIHLEEAVGGGTVVIIEFVTGEGA
jgi:chemotaxis family two-component system sensor kinase Cph1